MKQLHLKGEEWGESRQAAQEAGQGWFSISKQRDTELDRARLTKSGLAFSRLISG